MTKTTIADLQKKYAGKIDRLDLDVLIAAEIGKSREFVLTYPEYVLPSLKIKNLDLKITRRMSDEPLAYILGYREFFGLSFAVTPDTLIPRPETELMVEMALQEISSKHQTSNIKHQMIVDVGTGSGNIIISILKNLIIDSKFNPPAGGQNSKFFAVDISNAALTVAQQNAQTHGVAKKIKFLQGNLLETLIENCKLNIENSKMIILANLPYLSDEIYAATHPTVQKYEPRSALYSAAAGLAHYEELLQQMETLKNTHALVHVTCYMEISPEQKRQLPVLIRKRLPQAHIAFHKDLAQKWRLCQITV